MECAFKTSVRNALPLVQGWHAALSAVATSTGLTIPQLRMAMGIIVSRSKLLIEWFRSKRTGADGITEAKLAVLNCGGEAFLLDWLTERRRDRLCPKDFGIPHTNETLSLMLKPHYAQWRKEQVILEILSRAVQCGFFSRTTSRTQDI